MESLLGPIGAGLAFGSRCALTPGMGTFGRDLLFAIRGLGRSPGFTLSALLILTLGIGANTAIFSIVNAVLLRPLTFPDPDSVVTVYHVPPAQSFPGVKTFPVSAANYLDWKAQNKVFGAMAVVGRHTYQLGGGEHPQAVRAVNTVPDFFGVLRTKPAFGRVFTAEETQPGRNEAIVLSDGFATRQFGAANRAVGQTLLLDGRPYRVVGVMPRQFQMRSWLPLSTDAWVPLAWTNADAAVRGNHNYLVVARLRPGVSVAAAQTQMNVISERLARAYPEEDKGWGAVVNSVRDHIVGEVRPALLTLLGAVGFVLLIACGNTANLVLTRTLARRKELAIRAALGGTRLDAVKPVILETTLLAVTGGVLGLVLAGSAQSLVMRALADEMPQATTVKTDGAVLAFTLVASLATGILAGLIGCWRVSLADVNESLKQGLGKTDASVSGRRTRSLLVVCEVALSLVLLVGAGLMVRSLWVLRGVEPGFDPHGVVTMTVPFGPGFYEKFLSRVQQIPGVKSAGGIDTLPLTGGGSQQPITVEGRPSEVFALQPNIEVRQVSPGYLATMGIALREGRTFNDFDTSGKRSVVIISKRMAEQFWPGESAVGKRFRISFTPEIVREVIGVAENVKERGLQVLEPVAMLYEPLPRDSVGDWSLVVRSDRNSSGVVQEIRRLLREWHPEFAMGEAQTMEELVALSMAQFRYSARLFAALAGLAFAMAALGIYSVLSFSVRSRVTEISIRMALGARLGDVLRLVLGEGMRPTALGIVLGGLGAWACSGVLSRLVYGVSATDPMTFAAVAVLLCGVALLACLIPAFRAAQVQPSQALRSE